MQRDTGPWEPGSRWLSSYTCDETYLYCSLGDDCVSLQYNHPLLELTCIPYASESHHQLSMFSFSSTIPSYHLTESASK